jgi:N-acetylneuraminic acid mutarotase
MNYERYDHTASILTNGTVLVTGGQSHYFYLNSTELYDPSAGNWTITGNMTTARRDHTASILTNGKVLVTGGYDNGDYLNSVELYSWT